MSQFAVVCFWHQESMSTCTCRCTCDVLYIATSELQVLHISIIGGEHIFFSFFSKNCEYDVKSISMLEHFYKHPNSEKSELFGPSLWYIISSIKVGMQISQAKSILGGYKYVGYEDEGRAWEHGKHLH